MQYRAKMTRMIMAHNVDHIKMTMVMMRRKTMMPMMSMSNIMIMRMMIKSMIFMRLAVMAHNVDQEEIGVWQHLIPA